MRKPNLFCGHRESDSIMSLMKTTSAPLVSLLAALALTGLLASCPTIPANKTSGDWLGILPRDASFYLYINHTQANPVLKAILKKSGQDSPSIEAVLDNTVKSYLSVRLMPQGGSEVSFVLLGGYLRGYIRGVLKNSKDWIQVNDSVSYFQNTNQKIQVALPEPYMLLVSTGDIKNMLTNRKDQSVYPLQKQIDLDMDSSDLLLFFPLGLENNLADKLRINWRKISVQGIWLTARARDDGYIFSGIFLIANQTGARLFSTIFKLTLAALLRDIDVERAGRRLKDVQVLVVDNRVKITDLFFSNDELVNMAASLINNKGEKK
jgi:hypothetical protein